MPKKPFVLAIDQGTTGTHVAVLDPRLNVVGKAYREFTQHFPKPGWVEHDLEEIWSSVETCIRSALRGARLRGGDIAAIGITNQRETTGLWERHSGKPLHRAIVWQDRRTSERCAELKAKGLEGMFRERTGLVLDPYFSATKLEWLIRHLKRGHTRAASGDWCFGTLDTYLVFKLSGHQSHVTDVSNASRTLLFDLHTQSWEDELCRVFDIPRALLPEVRGSAEVYGHTLGMKSLPDGIPICGMAGDQQAALFGQACFLPGESKCTYGTGAFLLMNTGSTPVVSKKGLLTTVAWRLGKETTYALEGASFIAGAAVQWLRDGFGLISRARDIEALARKVSHTGDVVFVPALAGLGAPHWRPEARGLFAGIDRSTTAAHLARAVLEGVALQISDLAIAMREDSGRDIPTFKADGGAASNDLLMQYQADILGTEVVRPQNLETTSLGAAFLGGLGAGVWDSPEAIRRAWKADKRFLAKMSPQTRLAHLEKWRRAVERA